MARREYTDEIKAKVIAGFALGESKSALAKKYQVPRTTIIAWINDTESPIPTVSDTSQRERLGELVYEYLVTGFEALIAQHRVAGDATYIGRSSTPLAEVYKAIHGGVVSVAQAVERGSAQGDEASDVSGVG